MSVHMGSATAGDVGIESVVAGNLYQGIPPEQILPQLLGAIHDQGADLEADRRNREVRQNYLDARLDEIRTEVRETRDAIAAEQASSRAVLSRMTLALTIQSVSLGALLVLCVGVVAALLRRGVGDDRA